MNDLKDGREWIGKEGGVLYDVDDDGICTITMNRPEAMVSGFSAQKSIHAVSAATALIWRLHDCGPTTRTQ